MDTSSFRNGPNHLILHLLQAWGGGRVQQNPIEMQQKMVGLLTGIKKYQTWPTAPYRKNPTVVKTIGPSSIIHIGGQGDPIVLVPSLINGADIFNLSPDQSFARFWVDGGYSVYVLDWGDVAIHPQTQDMAGLLTSVLGPAIEFIAERHRTPVIQMGYCLGGLLCAGGLPWTARHTRAVIYLATPWDFHAGSGHMNHLVAGWTPVARAVLATHGSLPNSWVQALFATVDPEQMIQKYTHFATRRTGDPAADVFVAVEDWLQTGRDLPGALVQGILGDFYEQNLTARGLWQVAGHRIDRSLLSRIPAHVVAPTRDRLVEHPVAIGLMDVLGPDTPVLTPDLGHIGLMASPRAKAQVWEPLAHQLRLTTSRTAASA